MNWVAVLGAVGIVIGLAGTGAVIYFAARTQYGKSTVEQLKTDVGNWQNRVAERDARIDNLEEEAKRKDAALHRMGEQIDAQERQLADLREMVLQRAEFAQLVKATELHEANAVKRAAERRVEHSQMMAQHTTVIDLIHEAIDAVKSLGKVMLTGLKEIKDKLPNV